MKNNFLKYCWLVLVLLGGCVCASQPNRPSSDIGPVGNDIKKQFYNLEAIDLGLPLQEVLSFSFNGKELSKEGELYVSDDLVVYKDKEGKWQATVIGMGGIDSTLKIIAKEGLIKEIPIQTTSEVFPYQDLLGPQWPGIYNIGNSCFANAIYKLIARCPGFDQVLSQDIEGAIHTSLRNIVNGIRLGERSALHDKIINNKVSKLFLDQLSTCSGEVYNAGKQEDSFLFLYSINSLLYKQETSSVDEQNLSAVIDHINLKQYPFAHVTEFINRRLGKSNIEYYLTPALTFNLNETQNERYLSAPQYLVYSSTGANKEVIQKTAQASIWDHKTNQKLKTETYKLIGFAYHVGSTNTSGHYIADINFNEYGWYKHNDDQVSRTVFPESLTTYKVVAFYALQDKLER
jgi:hypothetical protein